MFPYWKREDCQCCGAALGPCINWPWHYPQEDCRAIRNPDWQRLLAKVEHRAKVRRIMGGAI